ncbi:MAG: hypothetical protein R3B90_20545 [Planctomycetaceae bacterium]
MPDSRSKVPPIIAPTELAAPAPPPLPADGADAVSIEPSAKQREPGWLGKLWLAFVEFCVGTATKSGVTGSLLAHVVVLVGLALILIPLEGEPQPPKIITVSDGDIEQASIGESISDVQGLSVDAATEESTDVHSAIGGSLGNTEPDLSGLNGPPSGRGSGTGSGVGDGSGADIAGRVQAAGGKGGALQISLAWEDTNDLDLAVLTPQRELLYWGDTGTSDGGTLDVDSNAMGVTRVTRTPVENITWSNKTPPDGEYMVRVHFFGSRPRQSQTPTFRVRLQIAGEVRVLQGKLQQVQQQLLVAKFAIKDSQLASLDTTLSDYDGPAEQLTDAIDPKRIANRERFAKEALVEAQAEANMALRAGKLRRLIERFAGTEAATEAQRLLQSMAAG